MKAANVFWKTGEESSFFFNKFSNNSDSFVFVIDGGALVIIPTKLIDGIEVSE